jgi:hypothetical protein
VSPTETEIASESALLCDLECDAQRAGDSLENCPLVLPPAFEKNSAIFSYPDILLGLVEGDPLVVRMFRAVFDVLVTAKKEVGQAVDAESIVVLIASPGNVSSLKPQLTTVTERVDTRDSGFLK